MEENMAQSKYRNNLPQLSGDLFLTDGGMETTLVLHQRIELPEFAAFTPLKTQEGRKILREFFDHYLPIAVERELGFVLESATWRANPDWAEKIGYSREELAETNRRAI